MFRGNPGGQAGKQERKSLGKMWGLLPHPTPGPLPPRDRDKTQGFLIHSAAPQSQEQEQTVGPQREGRGAGEITPIYASPWDADNGRVRA